MSKLTLTEAILALFVFAAIGKIFPEINVYNILIIAIYLQTVVKEQK